MGNPYRWMSDRCRRVSARCFRLPAVASRQCLCACVVFDSEPPPPSRPRRASRRGDIASRSQCGCVPAAPVAFRRESATPRPAAALRCTDVRDGCCGWRGRIRMRRGRNARNTPARYRSRHGQPCAVSGCERIGRGRKAKRPRRESEGVRGPRRSGCRSPWTKISAGGCGCSNRNRRGQHRGRRAHARTGVRRRDAARTTSMCGGRGRASSEGSVNSNGDGRPEKQGVYAVRAAMGAQVTPVFYGMQTFFSWTDERTDGLRLPSACCRAVWVGVGLRWPASTGVARDQAGCGSASKRHDVESDAASDIERSLRSHLRSMRETDREAR